MRAGRPLRVAKYVRRRALTTHAWLATRHSVSIGQVDPELILVAGTGRSGTTWLTEQIANHSRRRVIFEPFRNDRVPAWSGAAPRQYIRPGDHCGAFADAAQAILEGRIRNEWLDYYNRRVVTVGRVIKDIRANLILRWLFDRFGPFPLIYLIRHPGAVASSWRHEGWSATLCDTFLSQTDLVADFLAPFADTLKAIEDPWERLIYFWCVENYVPLKQFDDDEMLIVFYENLVTQPHVEGRRIADYCGVEFGPSEREWSIPSTTATTSYNSQSERLVGWRQNVSDEQMRRFRTIAAEFGLAGLYDDESWLAGPPRPVTRSGAARRDGGGAR